jgi:hypothetical protein
MNLRERGDSDGTEKCIKGDGVEGRDPFIERRAEGKRVFLLG